MSADPHDPKFQKWLLSLEPRQELVIRFALREHFPKVRADRANDARVDELRAVLKLDEDRLAMILADARMVAKDIERVIDPQPETKTRERIGNPTRAADDQLDGACYPTCPERFEPIGGSRRLLSSLTRHFATGGLQHDGD